MKELETRIKLLIKERLMRKIFEDRNKITQEALKKKINKPISEEQNEISEWMKKFRFNSKVKLIT